jgi:hypothetical protein
MVHTGAGKDFAMKILHNCLARVVAALGVPLKRTAGKIVKNVETK